MLHLLHSSRLNIYVYLLIRNLISLYRSTTTGSDGVSFRLPHDFLSQQRLHITSCVNKTRHISGFLS